MNIYIGADHRGFELKEKIKSWLLEEKYDVFDCGNRNYEEFDDAVDFAEEVADKMMLEPTLRQYSQRPNSLGIVICGSGIAVNIAMNRRKYIRCALAISPAQIQHGVENDHINAVALPSEHMVFEDVKEIIKAFLTSEYNTEDKYIRRIGKLDF